MLRYKQERERQTIDGNARRCTFLLDSKVVASFTDFFVLHISFVEGITNLKYFDIFQLKPFAWATSSQIWQEVRTENIPPAT